MLYIECRCGCHFPAALISSSAAAVSYSTSSYLQPSLARPPCCSAKTSKGVQDAFEELSQKVGARPASPLRPSPALAAKTEPQGHCLNTNYTPNHVVPTRFWTRQTFG